MNSNIEGTRVYGDKCKEIDGVEFSAYIGLLLLAGVFKSCNECTESLWDAEKGRPIFRATMSLQRFFHTSRVLRFNDQEKHIPAGDKRINLLPFMTYGIYEWIYC